jgi:small subunit ribosomal protein S2
MSDISLSQLLEAGVHFGHKAHRWNPKMFPYIYSEVNNIHILDLIQSATLLKEAKSSLELAASEEKTFLFVGTKRQATTLIAQAVKDRIERLKDLEKQEADGTFDLLTKKEVALRRKELIKLRKHLEGIKTMKELPDVAIIIDQKREMTAISECRKLGIPIVSILDTNCDPDLVDIPIPGNDDAVRSIKLILNALTDSILAGQSRVK